MTLRHKNLMPCPIELQEKESNFPIVGFRFGPAAGFQMHLHIKTGAYHFHLGRSESWIRHPNPYTNAGTITNDLRADIIGEGIRLSIRNGWRMVVRWSECETTTIYRNSIIHKNQNGECIIAYDEYTVNKGYISDKFRLQSEK